MSIKGWSHPLLKVIDSVSVLFGLKWSTALNVSALLMDRGAASVSDWATLTRCRACDDTLLSATTFLSLTERGGRDLTHCCCFLRETLSASLHHWCLHFYWHIKKGLSWYLHICVCACVCWCVCYSKTACSICLWVCVLSIQVCVGPCLCLCPAELVSRACCADNQCVTSAGSVQQEQGPGSPTSLAPGQQGEDGPNTSGKPAPPAPPSYLTP